MLEWIAGGLGLLALAQAESWLSDQARVLKNRYTPEKLEQSAGVLAQLDYDKARPRNWSGSLAANGAQAQLAMQQGLNASSANFSAYRSVQGQRYLSALVGREDTSTGPYAEVRCDQLGHYPGCYMKGCASTRCGNH